MSKPTLKDYLKISLYLGATGYGGMAIMANIKRELVEKKEWTTESEFLSALSLSQILPGAYGLTVLTHFGYRFHKLKGALLSAFSFIMPSVLLVILLSWAYFSFGNLPFVKSTFVGLSALVVGLLANATFQMSKSVFKERRILVISILTSLFVFVGYLFSVSVIYLILFSAFAGIFMTKVSAGENAVTENIVKKHGSNGFFILFLPTLSGLFGLYLVFLKIGALTFGGGFAAIPLIQSEVVNSLHWLNMKQFADGIAIGQITPGPVLITATFIGYKVRGIIGALVATAGIFTPSVMGMILLTKVHGRVSELISIQRAVKGIQAGFIGLLLAITLQFGLKSIVDYKTLLICLGSLLIVAGFKKDPVWAILGTVVVSLFIF